MNTLDNQYKRLLETVLEYGVEKSDRTGTGTKSIFGYTIRHNMSDGFPLLTTKKIAVKTMMTELKWFLKGDTNIKYLIDNGCNIWNGDAYRNYKQAIAEVGLFDTLMDQDQFTTKIKADDEFASRWGELGPIYGKQWRRWKGFRTNNPNTLKTKTDSVQYYDQLGILIEQLKRNPDSRRLMVSAWNVADLELSVLPPCHYGFQCYVANGKLSLMWNQRSVDTFLGLPFNIASYGTLLLLLCEETGYRPGELVGNLGDVHLYANHLEQTKLQLTREGTALPDIILSDVNLLEGEFDYEVLGYKPHPAIKAPLSN